MVFQVRRVFSLAEETRWEQGEPWATGLVLDCFLWVLGTLVHPACENESAIYTEWCSSVCVVYCNKISQTTVLEASKMKSKGDGGKGLRSRVLSISSFRRWDTSKVYLLRDTGRLN